MKKVLVLLFMVFFTAAAVFAEDNCVFNLENNKSYILLIDDSAVDIKLSDEKILSAFPVVTLDSDKQQILIQTFSKGISELNIKTPSVSYNYKINVVDNSDEIYDRIIELDIPAEGGSFK